MAEPQVVDSFLSRLAQSKLVTRQRIKVLDREIGLHRMSSDAEVARLLVQSGNLTRFQADRLLEGRCRGFYFDQYKVLDVLGMGGMGWIYKAEDTRTGQIVALKVLLDHLKNDRGLLARFRQEARAGLQLRDPHVLQTHKLGRAGDQPYMILEFVEGVSLLELIQSQGRLPWQQACDIIRQAALGLHHGHGTGMVHRDVKPQNLLINQSGHVKVLDFGLALIADGAEGDEFSMAMIFGHECPGTVAFMAPEQARNAMAADARSDVYSLGCTFYAALTGAVPFPRKSVAEVLEAHRTEVPRPVQAYAPSVSAEALAILDKMLAKNPADRLPSTAEVARALAPLSQPCLIEFDFPVVLANRLTQACHKMSRLKGEPAGSSVTIDSLPFHVSGQPATGPLHMGDTDVSVDGPTPASPAELNLGNPLPSAREFALRRDPYLHMRQAPLAKMAKGEMDIRMARSRSVLVSLDNGQTISLTKSYIVAGRHEDCHLQLLGSEVSGRQCEFRFDGRQWWLTDLDSRNGTRVNGVEIKTCIVRPGDRLTLGTKYNFRMDYDPCYLRETLKEVRDDLTDRFQHWIGEASGGISSKILLAVLLLCVGWYCLPASTAADIQRYRQLNGLLQEVRANREKNSFDFTELKQRAKQLGDEIKVVLIREATNELPAKQHLLTAVQTHLPKMLGEDWTREMPTEKEFVTELDQAAKLLGVK